MNLKRSRHDFLRGFVPSLFFAVFALNALLLAIVAMPLRWLWNAVLVPWGSLPPMGYPESVGILLVMFLVKLATQGVKLSATIRA
jgi:hypothetical protein